MKPITFVCQGTLSLTPDEIVEQILDVSKWSDFHGYGPIPGIKSAEFEIRTPNIVGSRIRVTNRDGSQHTLEIVEWQPDQRLQLRFGEFSAPLSRLASEFSESWEFQRSVNETIVTRSFEMHAKSMATLPLLWLISFILKKAIARHLQEMKAGK
jgi:hypothetical protein